MQRFKDFTKKSGKVASAILSAAMVTSMVAGTNVVYAANTEAQTEETDVTAAEKTAKEKAKAIKAALESLPVNVGTKEADIITGSALKTEINALVYEKVGESLKDADAITNSAFSVTSGAFKITEEPTADKKGSAELKFTYDGVTETAKYTLASSKERAAVLKAAVEEEVEKTSVTTTSAVSFAKNVVNAVKGKTDDETGMKLYADLGKVVDAADLTLTPAEAEKAGSAKGTFEVEYNNSNSKRIGKFIISVDKTIPSNKETVETTVEEFKAYLDTVKYFGKDTTDVNPVVAKFLDGTGVTTDSAVKYTVNSSADKTEAGEGEVNAVFKAGTTTASAVKTVTVPSDEQKTDLILSDLVKYAKASSNDSNDAFYADFAKAFNEDNTKINTAAADVDADHFDTTLTAAVKGVYGNTAKAEVKFGVKAGKTVADITVKFGDVDEKTETVELAGEQEAPKGQFVEKDGKKYFYDANGELVKNRYIQADESGDGGCYWASADGSVYQDQLSYDPSGKEVIYFDAEGHMAFDKFVNVKKDVAGNPVDYIGFFDSEGRAYVNQTTYGNGEGAYSKDALFYINDYGVLENKGWFKNAAGEIGYAAPNGTLTTSQWSLDQFGRKVYFQANGFLAKGLMTDGVKYYQLDETDGHLVGEF